MICERCGYQVSENAPVCPRCGTANPFFKPAPLATEYGTPHFSPADYSNPLSYQQGYVARTPQPVPPPSLPPDHTLPAQHFGAPPPHQPVPVYPQHIPGPTSYPPNQVNVTIINTPPAMVTTGKNDGAMVAEILLSLIGIFGVGWLISGEITVGTVLLVCSFFLYWPIMIIGTIITYGIGLFILFPLAIAAIIVNAILLSMTLNKKAARYTVTQQQQHHVSYQQPQPIYQQQPPPRIPLPPQ